MNMYSLNHMLKYLLIFVMIFGCIILPAHAQYMGNTLDPKSEISFPVISTTQTLDNTFELKSQQTMEILAENLSITFLQVIGDSRCASDVTCVWAGMVSLKFKVSKDQQNEITLNTHDNNTAAIFDKYQIQLIDVKPYPVTTKEIKLQDYVAVLKITKDNVSETILSPLKQFKSGISADKIQCKEGFQIIMKSTTKTPACVRPQSVTTLLIRGWGMQNDTIDLEIGQRVGSILLQKIFSDHITGLNFMDYPVAREDGFPITLHIGEKASNGCTVEMTLLKINENTATFLKKEYNDRPCPICLSEDTVIDTPNGKVNIKELNHGVEVFTQDASGNKQIEKILKTGKTVVSSDHKMVHIVLVDNRELYGSPNHPTTDGKILGELQAGDILDNSKIQNVEIIPYTGAYTYDVLPSGDTGFYWANGILIKSTLE